MKWVIAKEEGFYILLKVGFLEYKVINNNLKVEDVGGYTIPNEKEFNKQITEKGKKFNNKEEIRDFIKKYNLILNPNLYLYNSNTMKIEKQIHFFQL